MRGGSQLRGIAERRCCWYIRLKLVSEPAWEEKQPSTEETRACDVLQLRCIRSMRMAAAMKPDDEVWWKLLAKEDLGKE